MPAAASAIARWSALRSIRYEAPVAATRSPPAIINVLRVFIILCSPAVHSTLPADDKRPSAPDFRRIQLVALSLTTRFHVAPCASNEQRPQSSGHSPMLKRLPLASLSPGPWPSAHGTGSLPHHEKFRRAPPLGPAPLTAQRAASPRLQFRQPNWRQRFCEAITEPAPQNWRAVARRYAQQFAHYPGNRSTASACNRQRTSR